MIFSSHFFSWGSAFLRKTENENCCSVSGKKLRTMFCLISDILFYFFVNSPLNAFWLKLPYKFSNSCKLCWYWVLRDSVFSTIWANWVWSSIGGVGIFNFSSVCWLIF